MKRTKSGRTYSVYKFVCTGTDCENIISCLNGYQGKHTGKCRSCCQKKRLFQASYSELLKNGRGKGRAPIEVNLTYGQFYQLCQELNCHYCNEPVKRSSIRGTPGYKNYALDRKDNNRGYSMDNCVTCCWRCNQIKGENFTYSQFLEIARKYLTKL